MKRHSDFLLAIILLTTIGCGRPATKNLQPPQAVRPQTAAPKRVAAPKTNPAQAELDLITRAFEETQTTPKAVGRPESDAVEKIAAAIKASMELGPTLVVWIVDRTPSAEVIVKETLRAAAGYYESPEIAGWSQATNSPLLTALLTFDDSVQFVIDPPTGDVQKLKSSFASIQRAQTGAEKSFTAIKQALEKYQPLRLEQRREVLFVLVTDEAGDDGRFAEELVAPLRRSAIPLYVIGLPAPWGQTNPFATQPKTTEGPPGSDAVPTVGPESRFSERVDIQGWSAGAESELVDSGFGPFALERLCRASRGQYLFVRPEGGNAAYAYAGMKYQYWPPGHELRFDDEVVRKYAPDYVSEEEYRKLLSENRACAALHDAAKLPKVAIEGRPLTRFPKETEAKMAKKSSLAQQFAARNAPGIDQLYAALAPGEADREKLASPRWQAQFDLAIGRVLAAKSRLDGYNSMIAALKRGKTFSNSDSTAWVLVAADSFETESTLRRLGERAKMYLERVVKDHPGTPWARIAEAELKTPLGWTWKEE